MLRIETKSRARALQLLYAWELRGRTPVAQLAIGLSRLTGPEPRVLERAEALGLPIFLHPMMINNERMKQYYLINLLGNPFETAIAASHLIYGGVLDRFPRLEISLPHAGGALPILRGRLDQGWRTRAECKHLPRAPSEYLRRFTYDTLGHDDRIAFHSAMVGIGHLDEQRSGRPHYDEEFRRLRQLDRQLRGLAGVHQAGLECVVIYRIDSPGIRREAYSLERQPFSHFS